MISERRVGASNARKDFGTFRDATNRTAFQTYSAELQLHFADHLNISPHFYLHQRVANSARFKYVPRIFSIHKAIRLNLHSMSDFEILWLAKSCFSSKDYKKKTISGKRRKKKHKEISFSL